MIIFPKISRPSYPLNVGFENNSLMSKFEDGSVQSRPKFTRNRRTFKVTWKHLTNSEFSLLNDFIRNTVKYSAESFLFENPATFTSKEIETVEVRIIDVGEATMEQLDFWSITLTLQEV